MKKTLLLFMALIIIQACTDDDNVNIQPDELSIQVVGNLQDHEVVPFEVGDGNLGLDLTADSEGELKLGIDTDQSWKIKVDNLLGGQGNWFDLDTLEGDGTTQVAVLIKRNEKREQRSTSVAITTKGAIPITKKITVRQTGIGFLDVKWEDEFFESEVIEDSIASRLVMSPEEYDKAIVGSIDTKFETIIAKSSEKWAEVKVEEGNVILSVDENKSYEKARSSIITLTDPDETVKQSIEVYQSARIPGSLEVAWEEKFIEEENGDTLLVFKPKSLSGELIGSYETDSEEVNIKGESSEDWAKITVDDGKILLELEENSSYSESRSSILTLTNPDGGKSQTVKIKQKVKEEGSLKIEWDDTYTFKDSSDDETLIFAPAVKSQVVVGEYDADTDDLETSSSESWAEIEIDKVNGKLLLNLEENSGNNERKTVLTVTNTNGPNGGIQQSIELTQYGLDNIVDKGRWSIEPGNNNTSAVNGGPFSNIIDGDPNTHWEWDWVWDRGGSGVESKFPDIPYEFIIDFSESQVFNVVKLWQTQTNQNGYVKDVQFQVSKDGNNWEDLGVYRMADDQDDAETNYKDPYIYQLPGVYDVRYIKLIILSNVGGSKVNVDKNAFMGELDVDFK